MVSSPKPLLVLEPRNTRVTASRILLPVLFLGRVYFALFSAKGFRKFGWQELRTKLTPQESQELDEQSQAYLKRQDFKAALQPTIRLYRAYPENHIYIGRLAEIYDHLGNYAQEAKYWERFLDYAPVPIEGCPQIGQAYWKQGDGHEAQAVAAFERCLVLDPQNTDSIFYLAHAHEMLGDWEQAATLYQKGLSYSPTYTDLRLGLARCWIRLDKAPDAKKIVDDILAKKPDRSDAMLTLGMVYLHEDKYAEAKAVLTIGAQLSSDPDFHVLLARIAEHEDDIVAALREYNKLVELRPNDKGAKSRRDALQAAVAGGKK